MLLAPRSTPLPATSSYSAFGVRRSALGVRCFSASSCGPLSVVRSPVPGTLFAIRSSLLCPSLFALLMPATNDEASLCQALKFFARLVDTASLCDPSSAVSSLAARLSAPVALP